MSRPDSVLTTETLILDPDDRKRLSSLSSEGSPDIKSDEMFGDPEGRRQLIALASESSTQAGPGWQAPGSVDAAVCPGLDHRRSELPAFDLMVLMERPFFALSARSRRPISYVSPDGKLRISAAFDPLLGPATLEDSGILTYMASLIVSELKAGKQVRSEYEVRPQHLLSFVGRGTGGRDYKLLQSALQRLSSTEIVTNIGPDGQAGLQTRFRFIEQWAQSVNGTVCLWPSKWFCDAVHPRAVLKINPAYFGLGPLERFLYRTARKHAGGNGASGFTISLPTLHAKSGSSSPLRRFTFEVRQAAERGRIPDYRFVLDAPGKVAQLKMVRVDGRWGRGELGG